MLLGLLIYSYATGTFGSRRIEQRTYDSVPARLLAADTHPDHDTLCTFRRENKDLLVESFVKVLQLAQQLKVLKVGQLTVAADGTKVLAHASKYSAVSYQRAGEMIQQLELEVQQLLAKAEQADATPLQDGLTIPEEITRRQERQAALARARAEIEARAQARYATQLAEHEAKRAQRAAKKERGERVGGKPPQAPSPHAGTGRPIQLHRCGEPDHEGGPRERQSMRRWKRRGIIGAWPIWNSGTNPNHPPPTRACRK
jgi:hypothetical protein